MSSMSAIGQPTSVSSAPLEQVVHQLSETVLATTEAVDVLALRIDQIGEQVHQHECQLFAIGEDLKHLSQDQHDCLARVDRLTQLLEGLAQSMLTTLRQ
jgi:hypothetical protein